MGLQEALRFDAIKDSRCDSVTDPKGFLAIRHHNMQDSPNKHNEGQR
jgi:hypothetical protein